MIALRAWMRSPSLLASILAGVMILPFFFLVVRTPSVFEGGLLFSGHQWLTTGEFIYGPAYPPGIPLLFAGLEFFLGSLSSLAAVLVQLFVYIAGALLWERVLRIWFSEGRQRLVVLLISFANPYFLWLVLTSKDTAFEWFATAFFFFALIPFLSSRPVGRRAILNILLLGLAMTIGILVRATLGPIFMSIILVACVLGARELRAQLGRGILICALFFLGFLGYQVVRYDYLGLSSTMGVNMYLGQHPLYQYAHPQHDLDVFLAPAISTEIADGYSPQGDRAFRELALREIVSDPVRFVAVSLRKTLWHWVNFEKIPQLSANSRILQVSTGRLEIATDTMRYAPSLLYTMYKIFYIPAFILALFFWVRRRAWRSTIILTGVPMVILWPILILTFPDTRFKIVAEVVLMAFIAFELFPILHPSSFLSKKKIG